MAVFQRGAGIIDKTWSNKDNRTFERKSECTAKLEHLQHRE